MEGLPDSSALLNRFHMILYRRRGTVMSLFRRHRNSRFFKNTLALTLSLPLLFSTTGCDMIIINDLSWDNVSIPETDEKKSDETAYVPVDYTLYHPSEDYYGISEDYLNSLPKRDYDGSVFFITAPSTDYIDPDNTGNTFTRMVYERNRRVEEFYNVSIITSEQSADTILTEMKQAAVSDSYYTDLMMIPLYMTGQFRLSGLLHNLRSLPFLDLSAPYFHSESVAMTSAGYETYGVSGFATLNPTAFSAIFFNSDMVTEAGLELPYSLVKDRTWTWERFFEYTSAVTAPNGTEGTGIITVGAERNASRLADLIFISCGNTFINAASKQTPKIAFTKESAAYAVSAANRILTDSAAKIDADGNGMGQFAEGNMLFLCEYLSAIPTLTDSAANWGIVPLPLQQENDLYRTLISNNELILTVPANHTDGEFAGLVLSALNAASYGYLYEEYVNYTLAYHLRDNTSADMLEIILDTAAFDFALAFGNSYPSLAQGTYVLIREAAKNNDLDTRFDAAAYTTEKALARDFGTGN